MPNHCLSSLCLPYVGFLWDLCLPSTSKKLIQFWFAHQKLKHLQHFDQNKLVLAPEKLVPSWK